MNVVKKKCSICRASTNTTDDVIPFGDWMKSSEITVHYYCLLLSTNLPQRGDDCAGILGFFLRDIRIEIRAAAKRECCFCGQPNASISCYNCKDYFHLVCARKNKCLLTFCKDFRSYCKDCIPLDKFEQNLKKKPPLWNLSCYICKDVMGPYSSVACLYADCCKNGYVHRKCMQSYALAAGYYLKCIWCRAKSFREYVRGKGIFVPDREANWEKQRGAYSDLHRGHNRCDMEPCLCPRGREFKSGNGKWSLSICALCGSSGAHNPGCIPGMTHSKNKLDGFKCEICANTENKTKNLNSSTPQISQQTLVECMDTSLFVTKQTTTANNHDAVQLHETPTFSDEESISSCSSINTVIQRSVGNRVGPTISMLPPPTPKESDDNSVQALSAQPLSKCPEPSIIDICTQSQSSTIDEQNDVQSTQTDYDVLNISNTPASSLTSEVMPPRRLFTAPTSQHLEPSIIDICTPSQSSTTDNDDIEMGNKQNDDVNVPERKNSSSSSNSALQEQRNSESELFSINDDADQLNVETQLIETATPRTTQELMDSLQTQNNSSSEQSPHITSTSQTPEESETSNVIYLDDVYKMSEDNITCFGTCKLRIDMTDPRFAGKTIEEIRTDADGIITMEDVDEHYDSIGVFELIDSIIDEYV